MYEVFIVHTTMSVCIMYEVSIVHTINISIMYYLCNECMYMYYVSIRLFLLVLCAVISMD